MRNFRQATDIRKLRQELFVNKTQQKVKQAAK